jgi:transcriptional regulator GlxA family with amidase domain
MINTRNVAILIFDDVEVLDFAGPFEVFNVAGEKIKFNPFPAFFTYTVSLTGDMIVARGGLRVTPHFGLANCPQPDLLIIPGGFGARRLIKNPQFIQWLSEQAQIVENLLSVCTGALALAKADLLKSLSATTHHGAFQLLTELSPTTTVIADKRFVQNGNIFTSGGISAGIDMSLAVVEMLLGKDNADLVRTEMEWGWHPQPQVD